MLLDHFLSKHPTVLYASDMTLICTPLKMLGIDYFSHVIINDKHEMTANASSAEYFCYYFQQGFQQADLHISTIQTPKRYVLWKAVTRQGKAEELYNTGINFGLGHIFSIIEQKNNEKHYYHFAATIDKPEINEFYFQHLDLLEAFIRYYHDKIDSCKGLSDSYSMALQLDSQVTGAHLLPNSYEIVVDDYAINQFLKTINPKSQIQLCKREQQCAQLLLNGKTATEIAAILFISPRTVEVYLNRIKTRFGAKNKSQLIRALLEYSL